MSCHDVYVHILSYFTDYGECCKFELVCRSWRDIIRSRTDFVLRCTYKQFTKTCPKSRECYCELEMKNSSSYSNVGMLDLLLLLTWEVLRSIVNNRNLIKLSLDSGIIQNITILSGLRNLEHLSLVNMDIDFMYLVYLKNVPLLSLNLSNNKIDDKFNSISEYPLMNTLTSLNLSRNPVTGAVMPTILKIQNIKYLDISHTRIHNHEIQCVDSMPNLEDLNVANLCDATIIPTFNGSGLKSISLSFGLLNSNILHSNTNLTCLKICKPDDLEHQDKFRIAMHDWDVKYDCLVYRPEMLPATITRLCISNCNVNDLSGLKNLVHLNVLDLSGNLIQNDTLSVLSVFKKLKQLSLHHNSITSHGIKHVLQLPELSCLDLSFNDIGNEGVKHLSQLESIGTLKMCGCNITDISCLLRLKKLRLVDVKENNIPNRLVSKFKKLKIDIQFTKHNALYSILCNMKNNLFNKNVL